MVWLDVNGNGVFDADDRVVRYSQSRPAVEIAGSVGSVAFDGRGRIIGGPQNVGLKPEGHEEPARFLCINATGQTRIQGSACQ